MSHPHHAAHRAAHGTTDGTIGSATRNATRGTTGSATRATTRNTTGGTTGNATAAGPRPLGAVRRGAVAVLAAGAIAGLTSGAAHVPDVPARSASGSASAGSAPVAAPAAPGPYAISDTYAVGVSSGGYMAGQLHVAYSGTVRGIGIFSAGPYHCAKGALTTAQLACMYGVQGRDLAGLEQLTRDRSAQGVIDAADNLGGDPVYVYHGSNDQTVVRAVNDDLVTYYRDFGADVAYDDTTGSGHAWVSPLGPVSCTTTASPYINDCGNDPEAAMLGHLLGSVNPPTAGPATAGTLRTVDQNAYAPGGNAAAVSMDANGYVYVPDECESGASCRLLIALHGCKQSASAIGTTFVEKAYLNEYADTNQAIVLYPQAIPDAQRGNPNGCWDWWGYLGAGDYDTKAGPQMSTIMGMAGGLGG